jgi:hypothetical protein
VIGDGDTPTLGLTPIRGGTPVPESTTSNGATMAVNENGSSSGEQKDEGSELTGTSESKAPSIPVQLPLDVRQKLRKLERLEPKYSGTITFLKYPEALLTQT